MPEEEKTQDPIKHSFLIAGEPESNLALDDIPEDVSIPEPKDSLKEAEEQWRHNRSFAALSREELQDEGEDGDDDKDKDDEDKDQGKDQSQSEDSEASTEGDKPEGEPEKPKKKVKFKSPFEESEEPESEEKDYSHQRMSEETKSPESTPEDDPFGYTDDDKELIASLPPTAKDSLEFWQEAEQVDPKYKGYAKRQLEYIRGHKEKVAELRAEDPEADVRENPKYTAWVQKNKLQLSPSEKRRLDREIVINEAKKRLAEEQGKDIEELRSWKEQQEFERKNGPELQRRSQQFTSNLVNEFEKIAEEPMKLFREKLEESGDPNIAGKAMSEAYPDEANIIARNHSEGKAMADELLRVRMGFVQPDIQNNSMHRQLAERIQAQEQAMLKPSMKQYRERNGKTFAPAYEYEQMSPEEKRGHWTFSDTDVLNFLSAETLQKTQKDLENHKKNVERILSRYGKMEKRAQKSSQTKKGQEPEDNPRHEGADSPTSTKRASSEEESGTGSRLLDWNF